MTVGRAHGSSQGDEGKMKHTNLRLSEVSNQGQSVGWTFRFMDDGNAPLFWLAYDTEARAKEAHDLMAKALEMAIRVTSPSPR
jgi:hypothetical protein